MGFVVQAWIWCPRRLALTADRDFSLVVIDPAFANSRASEAAVNFFIRATPVPSGILPICWNSYAFLGLALVFALSLFALAKKLTGSFQELLLPFGYLDRWHRVVCSDLPEASYAAT